MRIFKNVLFDLDGTLLNTLDDLADSGNKVCEKFGWPTHPVEEYRYFVGNGIPKLVERFSPPYVSGDTDPETFSKALKEFNEIYGTHMFDKTAPYPGIAELLGYLHSLGLKMAVFSNKADDFARLVVLRYFDESLFKIFRGTLPKVPPKPDKMSTLRLLYDMGLCPGDKDTLYVGDSRVDVETAHNADLLCCGVLWGFRTKEELKDAGADFITGGPTELQEIILGKR